MLTLEHVTLAAGVEIDQRCVLAAGARSPRAMPAAQRRGSSTSAALAAGAAVDRWRVLAAGGAVQSPARARRWWRVSIGDQARVRRIAAGGTGNSSSRPSGRPRNLKMELEGVSAASAREFTIRGSTFAEAREKGEGRGARSARSCAC